MNAISDKVNELIKQIGGMKDAIASGQYNVSARVALRDVVRTKQKELSDLLARKTRIGPKETQLTLL